MSSARRFPLSLALVAALAATACGDPPEKEMQQAQGAIDAARAAGADQYAADEFAAAQAALQRANDAVGQRDYRLALNHALDARERAQNAAKQAADGKAIARTEAEHALGTATSALNDAHVKLRSAERSRAPSRVLAGPRRVIDDADTTVQKARAEFTRADYLAVIETLREIAPQLRAAAHDLDPFLMLALVAQESTFQADVRSVANAWGLMQIEPSTGRQYAAKLKIRPYTTARLKQPELNVRIGMASFAERVKKFGGIAPALAGYNAGNSRVVRWLAERPGFDQDEFIEDIPFPETQNYVKRILGTAEDYRILYGHLRPAK